MVGHGGSSTGSYLANPTSPIPSHCASIVVTSTLRVNKLLAFVAKQSYLVSIKNNKLFGFAQIYLSLLGLRRQVQLVCDVPI